MAKQGERSIQILAACTLAACFGCAEPPRPNILLYVVDTLRADRLGCYGDEHAATPRIDAFAEEALLFENAFAPSSWTRSSMASLFTGLYPTRHLTEDRSDRLPDSVTTLAEELRAAGYATAFVPSNPNVSSVFGFDQGFETLIELYGRREAGHVKSDELVTPASEVTERAIEWLESAPRPFFLASLSIDPHAPYRSPPVGPPGELQSPTAGRLGRQDLLPLYRGEIAANDEAFGALIEHLRERGELDSTLVVFTSDHGEEFWEHGGYGHGRSLYDEVLRVPLLLRWPESPRLAAGRESRSARLVDVVPTLLDLLEIEPAEALDGRSLLAPGDEEPPVFARLRLDGHALVAVREGGWKWIAHERASRGPGLLYRVSSGGFDQRVYSIEADAEARAAETRLRQRLAELAIDGDATVEQVGDEGLPDEVRRSLKALGYIEEE